MEKLTYTTEEQIINDAAQMLIEKHLQWSNSLDSMPHDDPDRRVYDMMVEAILDSEYTKGEWQALTKSEKAYQENEIREMFDKAAQLADRKWEAAMVLLGIEN